MNAPLEKLAQRISKFSLLLSILLIVCGVLAIFLPIEMSFGVVIVISWLLMIHGVVQFVHAIRTDVGHKLWKITVAVFYVLAGIYLRLNPGIGLAALTLMLIIFFVAQGFTDIFAYLATRKSGVSGWLLLDGFITLVLGVMLWLHWPSGSLWVVGTLVGVNMIMSGVTRLMLTLAVRRALKTKAQPA